LFIDSFLGGKQLHLRSDATVEYTLAADILTPTAKQYNLTSLVGIVHRDSAGDGSNPSRRVVYIQQKFGFPSSGIAAVSF
jgi:hypothetical protein